MSPCHGARNGFNSRQYRKTRCWGVRLPRFIWDEENFAGSNPAISTSLKGEINIECELEYNGVFDYYFFTKCLDEWIYQNLDIDIILDKISFTGIESLTKIEKEFLKKYKI